MTLKRSTSKSSPADSVTIDLSQLTNKDEQEIWENVKVRIQKKKTNGNVYMSESDIDLIISLMTLFCDTQHFQYEDECRNWSNFLRT